MPLWQSLLLFGIPTVLLFLATYTAIPFLNRNTGIPAVVNWFISGGLLVFIPLVIGSFIAYRFESGSLNWTAFKKRFRLNPLSKQDWLWTAGLLIFTFTASGLIMLTGLDTSPPFLRFEGISRGEEWILLAWLPFFFSIIIGEELMWRGYILPRQELSHGKWAWVINGFFWTIFHLSFGWNLVILLLPLLFSLPYVVQRQKNTWIGIIVHGMVNGLGFLSIALGLK
jgi:membrane protease YdiL (CAAX protease family)